MLFCKNFYSVFFDKNHIFNLGRKTVIICINGPAVVFIYIEFRGSLIDHWFNREHHTWDQNHLAALWSNITYKWFLMEFQTDSMTADLFYNRISVFLCVGIDRISNVSEMSPWFCGFEAEFHALFVTRTIRSASGDTSPIVNIRDASEK